MRFNLCCFERGKRKAGMQYDLCYERKKKKRNVRIQHNVRWERKKETSEYSTIFAMNIKNKRQNTVQSLL